MTGNLWLILACCQLPGASNRRIYILCQIDDEQLSAAGLARIGFTMRRQARLALRKMLPCLPSCPERPHRRAVDSQLSGGDRTIHAAAPSGSVAAPADYPYSRETKQATTLLSRGHLARTARLLTVPGSNDEDAVTNPAATRERIRLFRT